MSRPSALLPRLNLPARRSSHHTHQLLLPQALLPVSYQLPQPLPSELVSLVLQTQLLVLFPPHLYLLELAFLAMVLKLLAQTADPRAWS